MEKTKFTPVRWQVVDDYDKYEEGPQIYIWDGDESAHKSICDMGQIGDMTYAEELANAKLIAAAPLLYETLSEAITELEKFIPITEVSVLDKCNQALSLAK